MRVSDVVTEWGESAGDLLKQVGPPHRRKKQATILGLASVTALGGTRKSVWGNPACGSATAHGKWMQKDDAYRAAYNYIVGDEPDDPYGDDVGLAWQRKIAADDKRVDDALIEFSAAMLCVLEHAPDAVNSMVKIMNGAEKDAVKLKAAQGLLAAANDASKYLDGGK